MAHELLHFILIGAGGYATAGIAFAVAFVSFGIHRIDPSAAGASWRFRLIILPGVAAFWPLLLWRWMTRRMPAEERTAHTVAAGAHR